MLNLDKKEAERLSEKSIKIGLARVLGLSDATFIGVGALLGGGIFTLTGLVMGFAGPSFLLVIILNGFIALMTALAYAELGSAFPEAGGGFAWAKKGLGNLAGHITGWISWFANAAACSLYSISFGFYLGTIIFLIILPAFGIHLPFLEGGFFQKLIAVLVVLLIGWINYKGVRETSHFGKIIVFFQFFILLIFSIAGLLAFLKRPDFSANFSPFLPMGISGLLTAMGLMYIGFEGTEIIAQSGEEVKNPKKNIPRAIILALGIIVFLYFLTIFSALAGVRVEGEASWQILAQAGQGALVKAAEFFMPGFSWLMIFGGLLAATAALNATVFSSSHVFFAMARAGSLPKFLAKIHSRNHTPYIAVIISTLLVLFMAGFLPLKDVAAVVDLLFMFLFILLHLSLISLRKKLPDIPRGFKMPLYPLPSILALAAYLILVFQLFHLSPVGLAIISFWLLSGFLIFYIYAKPYVLAKIEKHIIFEEKIRVAAKKKYQILLPLAKEAGWENILDFALILAKKKGGELCILRVKDVPRPIPLRVSEQELENEKIFLEAVLNYCRDSGVNVDAILMIARSVSGTILEVAQKENTDLLILSWKGYTKTKGKIFGKSLDRVLREIKCDLIVARIEHLNDLKNILLPARPGPHTKFAGEIVKIIAENFDAKVNVLYVASEKESRTIDLNEKLEDIISALEISDLPSLKSEIIISKSSLAQRVAQEIVLRGQDFSCILMASARERIFRERLFGSIPEIVARNSTKSLILVKHHRDIIEPFVSYLKSRI